ncbi:MOSC domain-containing protein [Pseudogracilibacillus auburnensis]|uniref:MOSC domain-containing protein YiiM n=1 Tax=Pseudogracilibacillus auburnensis TaxID=1494959 RepID=A0A2V3WB19_9BACI|nr:MOSC domain-containing protein [Pseudogracilibacillus auburnensis]PXW85939.1 MOSC domain-containing protein YiiM [Pseudogracilibacillus auburnensis]
MEYYKILSINVGKPIEVPFKNKNIATGIFKAPIEESVYLSSVNFEGDGQGDLVHHGGKEKAVCVFPIEHYPFYENTLKQSLSYGAFGENLTTEGLVETEVCIGDIFKLGNATVQVSQPRQPCYKLSVKYDMRELPLIVQETGFTGYYLRVLEEGAVSKLDGLIRIYSHPLAVTVSYANRIMHHDKQDIEGINKLLEVEELSTNWKKTFLKRLEGKETDPLKRLTGNE